jgi:hypothetical protein
MLAPPAVPVSPVDWVPVISVTALLAALAVWYVTAMPGTPHRGVLPPLSAGLWQVRDRLQRHVEMLAGEIGERHVWRLGALEEAAQYIEDELGRAGYHVASQSYQALHAAVRNVHAEVPGHERADEIVVLGAHYDSVVGCPGANDNASGVAALIELARLAAGRRFACTVRFVAFVNEEPPFYFTGSMGSRVYARQSRAQGDRIVAMLSLETMGCYSDRRGSQRYPFPFGLLYPRTGNFIAFVGNMRSRALVRRCVGAFRRAARFPSEAAAAPGYLPGVFWSDHWSFWREGYRAVMVTDTAPFRYPHYHTAADTPAQVDYERLARVVDGLTGVVNELAHGAG